MNNSSVPNPSGRNAMLLPVEYKGFHPGLSQGQNKRSKDEIKNLFIEIDKIH